MGEKCNSGKIEREAMTLFYEGVVTGVLLNSEYYLRDSKYSIINKRDSWVPTLFKVASHSENDGWKVIVFSM